MYLILSKISHIIVNERAKGEKHKETFKNNACMVLGRRSSRRGSGIWKPFISRLERLGDETGVHMLREWEKEM